MQSCYPGSVHTFNKAASCVNVGNSSHPKLLPADHLRICEWQTVHGKSDNLFTAQMLGFAKKTPFQNEQEIMNKALIPLDIKPQKNGLTLEKELLNVPSSWLDHPFFTFKPGKTKKLVSASWNPSDVKDFNKAERYHELIIIHVTRADMISDNQTEIVSKFAKALASQLKGHGLQTQPFKWDGPTVAWQKVNKDKKPFNSTAERQEVVNGLLTTYLMRGDKSRMVFLILADKDAAVYSDIKRWGDCNLGIATVCVCPSAVVKKSSDILDNLSLKANFKLGGTNHIIGDVKEPSEHIESVQNDSLMIFGADFVSDLGGMIKERLQLYQGNNEGNLALNILFYRHGISESQFGMALTQELPQIYKACKEFAEKQGKSNIRITLLVVTKRHHTRLFPLKLTNSTENISGGLVVDKHIVNPNQMIFFLQSHDSALGTARPAHYTVTANQCELTLKQLERVTHKLSFVGFRATKGLSVCVPAQNLYQPDSKQSCFLFPTFRKELVNVISNCFACESVGGQRQLSRSGISSNHCEELKYKSLYSVERKFTSRRISGLRKMSSEGRKCSKCSNAPENTQHKTHSCEKSWPFWKDQVCDICFDPGHSCSLCPKKNSAHNICGICGHLHNSKFCPSIKAPDPKQYTREKYEAFIRRNPPRNQPHTVPSTSSAGPSQSVPSTATSVPQVVQSHATQAQLLPPGSVRLVANFTPPAKTEKEVEEEKRAGGFQQLVHRRTTPANVEARDVNLPDPVQANYFKVTFKSYLDLRRYRIQLDQINSKDVVKRELRRTLIKGLLQQNPPPGIWVSDYSEYIVSVGKLYENLTDAPGATVEILHHRPGRDQALVPMQSLIVYEGPFQRDALDTHVSSSDSLFLPDADLRMLNIISWFRINGYDPQNTPFFDGFRVGNRFYPTVGGVIPDHRIPSVNETIFLIRAGFFTSMRPAIGSVLLNVNTVTSAFFPPEILSNWIRLRWGQEIPPVNEQTDLIGLRVTFSGDGPIPKTRVIRDVNSLNVSRVNFTPTNADGTQGQNTSVYDHMRNKYHLLTFSPTTCCLNMGTTNDPKWYPADKLRIVAGQIFKKQLPERLGSLMIKIAQNLPETNKRLILNSALPSLGIPATTGSFSQFGLSINDKFEEVVPRYLRQPILEFKGGSQFDISKQPMNRSSWMLKDNGRIFKFAETGSSISNLHIIRLNVENNADKAEVMNLARDLSRRIGDYGVTITGNESVCDAAFSLNRSNFCIGLNAALAALRSRNSSRNPRLLLVVVPDKNIRTYANIKWWGDCVAGIPTICITKGVLAKGRWIRGRFHSDVGVISNISLKINFKLGGVSHFLNDEAGQRIFWAGAKANTMIVGADVSHAGKGRDATCPSMAGVVATCDQQCSQYFASARLQENNTESIADLADMIGERLDRYYTVNNDLPEHILFYRDGVSESQYGMVVIDEIPRIKAGCRAAGTRNGKGQNWCPKITLLVVGKRHHTRFFPKLAKTQKFNNNLSSGLLIDTGVVTPNHFSFYLQSHDSALGTARSAHYIVIINESDYTPESIHKTTNTICFTGSRAFKALSVCTPAKYADILCDRMRCYMKPALDSDFAATSPNNLDFYRSNAGIWNAPRQSRTNPWHPNLNNLMFYL
ncbi:putative piwi-domain-containing protein [Botrytis fragariae]|uniref:Putative piwi-domain-containing protein n=1 Tax=Botrytis fragariae TaxID=1964551 RepID=A0A8H6ATW1_9HELO|nr:putative piwi-domain-containing protein [Botrytis fragariae]KAF5873532.1 putative piwi-domain-containing protein [Botrytis fragariae]